MNPLATITRSAATVAALAIPMAAQCGNLFVQIPVGAFTDRFFAAVPWDPDGTGPQPAGVVVGGDFQNIAGQAHQKVAFYHPDSGTWSALPGLSSTGDVRALCVLPDGSLVAGGSFSGSASRLARWNGATWTTIGGGVSGGGGVLSLLVEPSGDLLVGGTFSMAGGTPAMGIARWNGTTWTTLPGFQFTSPLGVGITSLARASNGDIFAAGFIGLPGGWNVARWNGSAWTPVWTGASSAFGSALLALPNGDVMMGIGAGIYVWNGLNLQSVASIDGYSSTMRLLPDGDVLVAGQFTQVNLQPHSYIARWNGATWTPVAGGASDGVFTLAPLPGGDLLVAGYAMQRLSTSCPATVGSFGAGCAGTGGLNELTATNLPWIGSTFQAQATGMPASALVLSIYGVSQLSIPLPTLIPQGLAGCTALVTGEFLDIRWPNAGAVDTALAIPDALPIVGAVFHHYVVPFEFDPTMQLLAVTNSNALTCTVGAF